MDLGLFFDFISPETLLCCADFKIHVCNKSPGSMVFVKFPSKFELHQSVDVATHNEGINHTNL